MKITGLIISSIITLGAYAQKTDKVKVKYEFDMYPLETISKDKYVDVNVSLDYVEKVEAANADIAAKQEKARQDKENYEKKNFGEKLLDKKVLGETKPTGAYVNNDFIPTLFPTSDIEAMINIPGFTKKDGTACIVNATFSEFVYRINTDRTAVTYYPMKVSLSVINDKGVSVYQGDLPNNNASTTFSATGSNNLNGNYLLTMKTIETKAKNEAVANLNNYLKINYGFNLVKDDCPFFDVKDKKHQYPDYHEAIQKLETAFISVNVPERQEKFASTLRECITIWETNYKQLDKNDKNAKINKDVAAATTINLALAYTWLKEFDKAYDYLTEHKALGEDYDRAYNDVSKFLKDYNTRYNKYSKY